MGSCPGKTRNQQKGIPYTELDTITNQITYNQQHLFFHYFPVAFFKQGMTTSITHIYSHLSQQAKQLHTAKIKHTLTFILHDTHHLHHCPLL